MKIERWYVFLVFSLLLVSASSYLSQIYLFSKIDDTFFYMMQDFAFVPIQVLFVTLILDRLFKKREKQTLLKKMNMVIGIFYHEVGFAFMEFLKYLIKDIEKIRPLVKIKADWAEDKFIKLSKRNFFKTEHFELDPETLIKVKAFLLSKKSNILGLLSNPNLLEHDSFTDLLWAVFHLTDELFHRSSFQNLPSQDIEHLKGDLVRAYNLVLKEWVLYLNHLKKEYPFLYSIALRKNPLNPEASINIKK